MGKVLQQVMTNVQKGAKKRGRKMDLAMQDWSGKSPEELEKMHPGITKTFEDYFKNQKVK